MYSIELAYRQDVPDWLTWSSPFLTILAALVVGSVVLVFAGANPVSVYTTMFINPLLGVSGIVNIVIKTVPLLLVGLAVYLPMKAGLWNIGGDGQFYLGAIVATWIGISMSAPAYVLIPAMMLGAAIAGGAWGLIPGVLRAKWNVNEIIVSLLMTMIGVQLNQYMIQGPLQGRGGYPSSETLPGTAQLPYLSDFLPIDIGIHLGVIVALVVLLAIYILMNKMTFGFQIIFSGSNPEAAQQSGISTFRIIVYTMTIGGLIAGLAGMIELSAVQTRLQSGLSPDYGFTAVPIALLGQNGPLRVLLASLFFALLSVGANLVAVTSPINTSIIDVIRALVILFLLTATFFKRFEISLTKGGA
jgi:simple sugar transport system permease protein